ncbi:MAG: hypothetical protein LBT30_06305 [Clostridiales bacterium]|jgi:DNA repair exonuclease SbcCD ATPase subunit|nr:hypothetical protein [Clostridiales bacterium]
MKPQKLEFFGLYNFSENQTIDFGTFSGQSCFFVLGESDSGKEVIADLLVYALFGKTGETLPERFILNRKTKSAEIKLSFEHAGEAYFIERTFGIVRGKKYAVPEVAVYNVLGDGRYLAADGAAAESFITNLLGADAAGYRKALSVNVYNAIKLLSMSDGEQFKYIKDALGIAEFGYNFSKGLTDKIYGLRLKRAQALALVDASLLNGGKERLLKEYADKAQATADRIAFLRTEKVKLEARIAKVGDAEELRGKFDALNLEIDKLDEDKGFYTELEKKRKISAQASKVLPAYRRKENLEKQNEAMILKRDGLASKISATEAEIEALKIDDEQTENEYSSLRREYTVKKDALKESLNKNVSSDMKDDLKESLKKDRSDLTEILNKKADLSKKLGAISAECAELKKKINGLTVDPTLNLDMSKANSFEAALKRLLKEKKYLDKKAAELDDKINAAVRAREFAAAKILSIENEINKLGQEKFDLIGEGDIYTLFTREYQRYNTLSHQVGKVDTYNDNIKQITKKKQVNNSEIERENAELDRADATRLNAEKNLYNIGAKTEISQREREKVANVNYYVNVSNAVRVGEFCPVCNNVVTLKQPKTPLPMIPVDVELNKLRDDKTRSEEILVGVMAVIAGLNSNILHMKRLNQDLDRDERFYIDCINDILREEGFESVQLLYEAFLKQKEKYEHLRIIYDRAGVIIVETDRFKDALRDAENEKANAEKEIAIYSEQYNERKYAISEVDNEYVRELEKYTVLNSLSEYETPEKILKKLEEMASERLELESRYSEKYETQKEIEKLVAECDNLEILILSKAGGRETGDGAAAYSDYIFGAANQKHYSTINGVLTIEERLGQIRSETDESRRKAAELTDIKHNAEIELAGLNALIEANSKQIENLESDYITAIDDASYSDSQELEALILGYFAYEDAVFKLNEYRIRLATLINERDSLASWLDVIEKDGENAAIAEELKNVGSELKGAEKQLVIIEYETEQLAAKDDGSAYSAEIAEAEAELARAEKIRKIDGENAYADYVAALNAAALSEAAGADVSALTGGRYSLGFDEGIRVKDKLFDNKYRTLNTLDESDKLTIGVCLAAALSKMIVNGGSEILFLDGFDFIGAEYYDEFKLIIKKLSENYSYIGVMLKQSFENGKNRLTVEITEDGSVIR